MNIAIIRNSVVENIAVCESLELAAQLWPDAACVDGEGMIIGAAYPPGNIAPDPEPTSADNAAYLVDMDYRLSALELGM